MAKWNQKRSSGRERARQRQQELQKQENDQTPAPAPESSDPNSSEKRHWLSSKADDSRNKRNRKSKDRWAEVQKHSDAHALKSLRRRVGLAVFALIILALLVAFLYPIIRSPNIAQVVTVATPPGSGSDFFSSLPSGAQAWAFLNQANQTNSAVDFVEDKSATLFEFDDLQDFVDQLNLRGGGPTKTALMIYLTGVGVVDASEEPCLVELGKDPFQQNNWYPLKSLFERLGDLEGSSGKDLEVVVLLDSQPMDALVSPELMVDRFPQAVRQLMKELEDSRIQVMLSHDVGQQSWYAPELGRSVFAYYLARALAGEADGCLDGKVDETTTMNELSRYLRTEVFQWVNENRVMTQTPVLLSAASTDQDLHVFFNPGNVPPLNYVDDEIQSISNRMDDVQQLWKRFEDSVADSNYSLEELSSLRPYQLARLEMILTRLENLAARTGDGEFEKLKRSAVSAIDNVTNVSEFEPRRGTNELASLAEAASRHIVPLLDMDASNDPFAQRSAWLERLKNWDTVYRMPEGDERENEFRTLRGNIVDSQYTSPAQVRWLVWQWLRHNVSADGPSPSEFAAAMDLLNTHEKNLPASIASPEPEWTEIRFLRMLDRYIDWSVSDEATISQAIATALNCREASERFAFGADRRARYWLEQRYAELEATRRKAEDLLYVGQFTTATEQLASLPKEYATLEARGVELAERFDLYEKSLHALPYLVAWEFRRQASRVAMLTESDDGGFVPSADFTVIVGDLRKLSFEIDRFGAALYRSLPQARLTDIDRVLDSTSLDQIYSKCIARYNEAGEQLESDPSGKNRAPLVEIEHALLCPLANATRRAALRKNYLKILRDSLRDAEKAEENARSVATLQEVKVDEHPEEKWNDYQEHARQFWGSGGEENPFFTVEQRLGNSAEALLASLPRFDWSVGPVDGSPAARFEELADDWINEQERFRRLQRNQRFGVQHFLRRSAPYMVAFEARIDNPPRVRAIGEDLQFIKDDLFEMSMASRALEDFWGNSRQRRGRPYFARLAQLHFDGLTSSDEERQQLGDRTKELEDLANELSNLKNRWMTVQNQVAFSAEANARFQHHTTIELQPGLPDGVASFFLENGFSTTGLGKKQPVEVGPGQEQKSLQSVSVDSDPSKEVLEYLVPIDGAKGDQQKFEAVLVYRGHETMRDFYAIRPVGIDAQELNVIDFSPFHQARSKVTVSGGPTAISDVVVVVDCSNSMKEEVAVEGGTRVARMTQALRMANSLINKLKQAGNYRVALMAYGRRVNITQKSRTNVWNENILPDTAIKRWERQGVMPYNDVEILFGLSPLGRPTRDEDFQEMLDSFQRGDFAYWGQTPLYQALRDAARHLRVNGNAESAKHIVVITDGVNETYGGGLSLDDIAKLSGMGEVTELKGDLVGVKVHMVLYDVKSDDARKKEYLKQISKVSGVEDEVIDSSDASVIENQIGGFVVPNTFRITAERQANVGEPTKLDDQWEQDITQPGPHDLTVSVAGTRPQKLFLYGGEQLVIDLTKNGLYRYRRIPDTVLIKPTGDESFAGETYRFGLVDVEDPQDRQLFKVGMMLSNFDKGHTDRPGFATLDVTSQGTPNRGADFYRLTDFDYEVETSYPILRFPMIDTDRTKRYQLKLHLVPNDVTPVFEFRREVTKQSFKPETEQETIEIDGGPTMSVYLTGTELHVKVSSSDPKLVQDLVVRALDAVSVQRRIAKDWQSAHYRFTFEETALEPGNKEPPFLEVFKMGGLFNEGNGAIEIDFPYP